MLQLEKLDVPGLQPVTLTLEDGVCVAVQGRSGSGKSRLLRAIADLDPHGGRALLDGVDCAAMPAPDWRAQVTYLATDAGWWLSSVGAHFCHWDEIAAMLSPLGLAAECRDWPVARLSTGERQRLALLRALSIGPRVLLLDEPTSGLDQEATAAVERLLEAQRAQGLAMIWVTHDGDQAARVGKRLMQLRDGALVRP
jgi:ABC-type iron transport system FetAB ATPase subunit